MKIGLVSYECRNRDVPFNLKQIERALKETEGKADLLCFGEAYLQGFDSLCWDYETDKNMATDLNSEIVSQLCRWSVEYNTAILTGYIEKDQEELFSSCMAISQGKVIHNYRRISKGWKEYDKTDNHYKEGSEVNTFNCNGKEIMISLCGDLWDYPERFKTDGLLIWPVYLSISVDEWQKWGLEEYAKQAGTVASEALMINPIDHDPQNHGGSCYFREGELIEKTEYDEEEILLVEI